MNKAHFEQSPESNPLRSSKRTVFAAGGIVLLVVFCSFAFHGENFFQNSDLISYWSAEHLFVSGKNPYSPAYLLEVQKTLRPELKAAAALWNPPLFYVSVGLLFVASSQIIVFLSSLLSAFSFVCLIICGFKISEPLNSLSLKQSLLILLISFPLFFEMSIGQHSSFIAAAFALGYLAMSRRHDFVAGMLFSFLLLKPHVVFFPALLLLYRIISERRVKVVLGGVCVTACLSLLAEFLRPGVHSEWVHREIWPGEFFGATAASFLRALSLVQGATDPRWLIFAIPICTFAILLLRARRHSLDVDEQMMLWIGCSPLLSPYGYTFDQTVLIFPLAYFFAQALQTLPKKSITRLYVLLLMIWPAVALLGDLRLGAVFVFWYVYPLIIIGTFFAYRRARNLSPPSGRSVGLS